MGQPLEARNSPKASSVLAGCLLTYSSSVPKIRVHQSVSHRSSAIPANMLPIGQQLWLKHLESYIKYPPLQEAASYNLTQVIEQVKKAQSASHADE